jgi:hypothetical protein
MERRRVTGLVSFPFPEVKLDWWAAGPHEEGQCVGTPGRQEASYAVVRKHTDELERVALDNEPKEYLGDYGALLADGLKREDAFLIAAAPVLYDALVELLKAPLTPDEDFVVDTEEAFREREYLARMKAGNALAYARGEHTRG